MERERNKELDLGWEAIKIGWEKNIILIINFLYFTFLGAAPDDKVRLFSVISEWLPIHSPLICHPTSLCGHQEKQTRAAFFFFLITSWMSFPYSQRTPITVVNTLESIVGDLKLSELEQWCTGRQEICREPGLYCKKTCTLSFLKCALSRGCGLGKS